MNSCSWCGRQNPEDRRYCESCGTELETGHKTTVPPQRPTTAPPEQRASSLLSAGFFEGAEALDLSPIDMGYTFVEGFSYPDWELIDQAIRTAFPGEKWPQAWREMGMKWLDQLREDLGGNYRRYESWSFLLLSAE